MKIRRFFFCCISWLLFQAPCLGQNALHLTEITMKDGLSQGMIFDILQTSDGFMWFATKEGLNRYDGTRFVVYRHSPADSFSISDNTVVKLFEDSQQRLWVKTKIGLDIFDAKRQRFIHLLKTNRKPSGANFEEFASIASDKGNNLLLACANEGVYYFPVPTNIPPQKAHQYLDYQLIPLTEEDEHIYNLHYLQQQVFLTTNRHLYQINPITQSKNIIETDAANLVRVVKEDRNGKLWLFGNRQVVQWRGQKVEVTNIENTFKQLINSVIEDKEQHFWLAEGNLLWCTNQKGFSLQHLNQMHSLSLGKAVSTKLYCDKTGNIWVGTNGYGLRKINPKLAHFHHIAPNKTIWALDKDERENVYIKQYGEYFQLLPPNYLCDEAHPLKLIYPNISFSLLLDQQQTHWLLASEDHKIEGKDNRLIQTDLDWNPLKSYQMPYSLYQQTLLKKDAEGNFWFNAVGAQLIRFQPTTQETSVFDYSHLFKNVSPATIMFYFDINKTLWIGTNQGLVKGTQKNGNYTFQLFHNQANNPFSLPNNIISSFCDDIQEPTKFIWIGTKGGGLVKMEKTTGKCQTYSEKQGLPNAVVYGILPDEEGNLWISTNRGIARFNPKTLHFHPFTQDDGLQDNEFNTQAFSKSPKGELCFGGINGLNIFYPKEIAADTTPPKTVIVTLKVNNQALHTGDSTNLLPFSLQTFQALTLSYQQNYLSIEFATLDFTSPNKHKFKYRLEGIDRDWIYCDNQAVANYTALAPGTYTFKVLGCNGDGIWSKEAASLTFIISPPFWRTYWAYAFYALLLGFLIYQAHKYQIHRIELNNQLHYEHKEKERLIALDEVKNRFFSNVTHEFRTPLTLILEPARQLMKEIKDSPTRQKVRIIENNSRKLLQLVNQLLDLSKIESGSMKVELQYGDFIAIIQPIYESFLTLAQKKDLLFLWNYPSTFPPIAFDRDKTEKILYNLLSNAIKFTPRGGEIHLTTTLYQQQLQIAVKDTGVGMSQSQQQQIFQRFYQADNALTRKSEGTGVGLALVKELVELLEGEISIESKEAEGTSFIISLPLKNEEVSKSNPLIHSPNWLPLDNLHEEEIITALQEEKALVLLIEDNEDMRIFIKQSIENQGYKVIEAENGQAGIEAAFTAIPDLIISDVMMPEKDGYEVTKTLKTDLRTSHIPIILLTAKSSLDSKLVGLGVGADAYIGKPFHTEEVLIRIEQLIASRKILQSKFSSTNLPPSKEQEIAQETPVEPTQEAETTPPSLLVLSPLDKNFLTKLEEIIEQNLDNDELSVQDFTEALFLSRSQLHRKVVALTNQSISEFTRNYRLDKAKALLQEKAGNISEIAYSVGFKDAKYFSTSFKKRFGISPSEID